jgi:hypothetical protein
MQNVVIGDQQHQASDTSGTGGTEVRDGCRLCWIAWAGTYPALPNCSVRIAASITV